MATFIGADQQYPVHPDRFHDFSQVLCRESMCGRCYWEVEWSGMAGVGISVSYKSISRKGGGFECVFGFIISPGDCPALTPGTHSDTIRKQLNSLYSAVPLE